jgi:hypothetical protein
MTRGCEARFSQDFLVRERNIQFRGLPGPVVVKQ